MEAWALEYGMVCEVFSPHVILIKAVIGWFECYHWKGKDQVARK